MGAKKSCVSYCRNCLMQKVRECGTLLGTHCASAVAAVHPSTVGEGIILPPCEVWSSGLDF